MSNKMRARIAIGALVIMMGAGMGGGVSTAAFGAEGYQGAVVSAGIKIQWGDQGEHNKGNNDVYMGENKLVLPEGEGWGWYGKSAYRIVGGDEWGVTAEFQRYAMNGSPLGIKTKYLLNNFYGSVSQSGKYKADGERRMRWDVVESGYHHASDIVKKVGDQTPRFKDVKKSDWFFRSLKSVINTESPVIKGYSDGTFKPKAGVTEVEALVMGLRAMGLEAAPVDGGDWSSGYVALGLSKGVITAPPRNAKASRGYVIGVLNKVLENYGDVADSAEQGYVASYIKDISSIPADMLPAVRNVYANGIVRGYSDGTLKYGSDVTRAEMVATIERVLFRGQRLGRLLGSKGSIDVAGRNFSLRDISSGATVKFNVSDVLVYDRADKREERGSVQKTVPYMISYRKERLASRPGYVRHIIEVGQDYSRFAHLAKWERARAINAHVDVTTVAFVDLYSQSFIKGAWDRVEGSEEFETYHGHLLIDGEKVPFTEKWYIDDDDVLVGANDERQVVQWRGTITYHLDLPEWYDGLGVVIVGEKVEFQYAVARTYIDTYRGEYQKSVYVPNELNAYSYAKGAAPNLRGLGGDKIGSINVFRLMD